MKTIAVISTVLCFFAFEAQAQTVNKELCSDYKTMQYSMFSPEYHVYYGCGYYAAENYEAAASQFESGTKSFPNNAALFFHLGNAYAAAAAKNKTAERESLIAKARAAFAKAVELDASLKSKVNAVFASGSETSSVPNDSETDEANEPQVPAVGDEVEVEAIPEKWVRGKVTRIVGGLPCPVIEVEHDAYGDGKLRKLNFFCKSFRPVTAKTSDAQTQECGGSSKNCPPKSAPPLGIYVCNVVRWDVSQKRIVFDYQGYFTLKPGGVYSWLDNGGTGKYSYNAKTYKINWTSGHLSGIGGETEFGLDGDDPEITITFKTQSGDFEWQCALETK